MYYFDEPLNDILPPDGLDMSDFWVVQVMKSGLKPTDRRDKYPAVFASRYLRTVYRNEGRPSVYQDSNRQWSYDIIFDTYQMHGEEGYETLIFDRGMKGSTRRTIGDGGLWLSVPAEATTSSTDKKNFAAVTTGASAVLPHTSPTEVNSAAAVGNQETSLFGDGGSIPKQTTLKTNDCSNPLKKIRVENNNPSNDPKQTNVKNISSNVETKWSNFDQRIDNLEGSVYGAVYKSADEVKQFLEDDFNPRLRRALRAVSTAHTEALEERKDWKSQCE